MVAMQEFLPVAISLARQAGAVVREKLDRVENVRSKGTSIDMVTESDLASERVITEGLLAAYPDHGILGEEGGVQGVAGSAHQWIVDPLDGTTNYAHGLRQFCVCIGLEVDKVPALGVVYDPIAEEMFTAYTGGGAFLNGHTIHVSDRAPLADCVLATGFAYDVHTNPNNNLDRFCAFLKRTRAVRRFGSAGLDLCYTACGRFDGFWETFLGPWDLCAGRVILREAGATVTDFTGGEHTLYGGTTVASNGHIHQEMLDVIAAAGPHSLTETVDR